MEEDWTYSENERQQMGQEFHRVVTQEREKIKRMTNENENCHCSFDRCLKYMYFRGVYFSYDWHLHSFDWCLHSLY